MGTDAEKNAAISADEYKGNFEKTCFKGQSNPLDAGEIAFGNKKKYETVYTGYMQNTGVKKNI